MGVERCLGLSATALLVSVGALACPVASYATPTPTITEFTTGLTPNRGPSYITLGPDGNMWFTEVSSPGGVAKINATTGVITEVATGGVTAGFTAGRGPEDIVTGPDGNLWFVESHNPGAIAEISPNGGAVAEHTTPTPNSGPYDIARGPDGNLWFTEANVSRIGKVVPSTGVVSELTTGVTPASSPAGIVAGPDGNMWFTEYNNPGRVGRVNPSTGTITEVATAGVTAGFTTDQQPNELALGPDGNLWFGDWSFPGRIVSVNPATIAIREFTSGITGQMLGSIAVGDDGKLWVTEWGSAGAIARIDPATGVVDEFTTGLTPNQGPYGIAQGPDGNMWFTELGGAGAIGRITVEPVVSTGSATTGGSSSAALNGSVRPNSQPTTFHFQVGTSTSYGLQTNATAAGAGATAISVSSAINGLKPSTLYHYRIVATNPTDTSYGVDRTFTTPAATTVTLTGAPRQSRLTVRVTIICHAPTGGICKGIAQLTTIEKLLGNRIIALNSGHGRRHTRRVVLGSTRFSLRVSQRKKLVLSIGVIGRNLLTRFGRIPATVTITVQNANPPVVISRKATITAKAAR